MVSDRRPTNAFGTFPHSAVLLFQFTNTLGGIDSKWFLEEIRDYSFLLTTILTYLFSLITLFIHARRFSILDLAFFQNVTWCKTDVYRGFPLPSISFTLAMSICFVILLFSSLFCFRSPNKSSPNALALPHVTFKRDSLQAHCYL